MLIIVVYNFTSDSHFYLARLHNNIIYLDVIIIIIIYHLRLLYISAGW